MKIALYIIGVVILLLGVGVVWRMMVLPDLDQIEAQTEEKYEGSEISYPDNYRSLVEFEQKNERTFLIGEAVSGVAYENYFPYTHVDLSEEKTKAILNVFNDSTSYRWGEFGTPDHDLIIVYYNKAKTAIGYSLVNPLGEVENYPYRSVMKWGMLTDKAWVELQNQLVP